MSLKEIGAILLFLLAIVIFGNLWFSFVESLLAKIKKLFSRRQEPPAWHTLPSDEEERKKLQHFNVVRADFASAIGAML